MVEEGWQNAGTPVILYNMGQANIESCELKSHEPIYKPRKIEEAVCTTPNKKAW
jgi:hypothetical protein